MSTHNHFVLFTHAFGRAQHSTVIRTPIGESYLESGDVQFWTGKGWDRRERFAEKFPADGRAANRAMRRAALAAAKVTP